MPPKSNGSSGGDSFWQIMAGISGLLALLVGAVGAHVVADKHAGELIEKASLYQLIHTAVILLMATPTRTLKLARMLFFIGIIFFCGPIYWKALTGWSAIARMAPVGGISFMLGWLMVAWSGMRRT